jgi:4-alpha-glucanotransferase
MIFPRASGILLHPTSLPGPFGIGDLGPAAERFIDQLAAAGQRWWQVLPLGPAGAGNSPYQSFSAFAGNPLLISPERLAEDGLLSPADWADAPQLPAERVDFGAVIAFKTALLERAFDRAAPDRLPDYDGFLAASAGWLDEFALFMALKDAHGQQAWHTWEPELARRNPDALERARVKHIKRIDFHRFIQYQFDRQWQRLRARGGERGVGVIGDVPIFVALDSVDVWTRPELFQLDAERRPTVVAGVPPDFFSATGQLWGNPLYNWPAHEADGFAWWAERLLAIMGQVDVVRVDHFRGFAAYWEVPAGETTAMHGRWVPGPGERLFRALASALGDLPLIAEDLGVMDDDVVRLRETFGLPGMCILQFAFTGNAWDARFLPHNHRPNSVVYTGTHDNDTTAGWFRGSAGKTTQSGGERDAERRYALRYLGTDGHEIHGDFIRWALASVAHTAVVPLQDLLGLGSEARMNVPGTVGDNWEWRYREEQLTPAALDRLADLTAVTERWNGAVPERYRPFPGTAPSGWRAG